MAARTAPYRTPAARRPTVAIDVRSQSRWLTSIPFVVVATLMTLLMRRVDLTYERAGGAGTCELHDRRIAWTSRVRFDLVDVLGATVETGDEPNRVVLVTWQGNMSLSNTSDLFNAVEKKAMVEAVRAFLGDPSRPQLATGYGSRFMLAKGALLILRAAEERLQVTLGLRLTNEEVQRLDAIVSRVPIGRRHAIARAAFRLGLGLLEKNPTRLIAKVPKHRRIGSKPASST
jgi:hypothetical protein